MDVLSFYLLITKLFEIKFKIFTKIGNHYNRNVWGLITKFHKSAKNLGIKIISTSIEINLEN